MSEYSENFFFSIVRYFFFIKNDHQEWVLENWNVRKWHEALMHMYVTVALIFLNLTNYVLDN